MARQAMQVAQLLVIAAICFLPLGCGRPTRTMEVKSPDGRLIARALTFTYGGSGNSSPARTAVEIFDPSGTQSTQDVLIAVRGMTLAESPVVEMKWLSASELQLKFSDDVDVELEVTQVLGTRIGHRTVPRAQGGL